MSLTIQEYLATATEKAGNDLLAAYHRLPEDKRTWSPAETSRSAANQVAECALINAGLAAVFTTRTFAPDAMSKFGEGMAQLLGDLPSLEAALKANTAQAVEAIRSLPDDAFSVTIAMPWGARSIGELLSVPFWNMTYHEGQINYIASILDQK